MGSFCSRKSQIYAASSINTENQSEGQPIKVGAKDTNCKCCEQNEDNISSSSSEKSESTSSAVSGNSNSNSGSHVVANDKTRDEMVTYWKEHSQSNINKSLMLLMEDNPDFEETERKEIVTYLPNFEGMDCIELGAGIGRFTDELGYGGAKSLLAIDFIEKFILENEKIHKHKYPNCDMTFMCKDVTKLVLPDYSYDFVFSNWLMMYLDDEEVTKLAEKMYKWCRPGGYVFFRESCEGGASGDKPRTNNPTYYRKNEQYSKLFDTIAERVGDKNNKLTRLSINKVKIYVETKNKTNQYCWLYQKTPLNN